MPSANARRGFPGATRVSFFGVGNDPDDDERLTFNLEIRAPRLGDPGLPKIIGFADFLA